MFPSIPANTLKIRFRSLCVSSQLILIISLCLAGCGGNTNENNSSDETPDTSPPTENPDLVTEIDTTLYDFSELGEGSNIESIPLSPQWHCTSFTYNNDVWVRTYLDNAEKFDFRIGPGGVIAELRDAQGGYTALLSPSYKGEPTDRVIQWTWWSNSLVNVNNNLPDYEWRFNITQAGTFDSTLTPSFQVNMHEGPGCQIDIYSEPQNQWKREQEGPMSGSFSARTRYKIAQDGAIIIRRTLLVGPASLFDQPSLLTNEYVEAWTPFARNVMDAVAFAIDENGSPTNWYQAGNNLPSYPFIDVTTTPGYAVAMNNANPYQSPAVGLVFGKKSPCYHQDKACNQEGEYVLNLMEWDTGVGILPGLTLPNVNEGDLLDSYIVLQPSHGLNAQLYNNLSAWAERIPAPRLIRNGADVGDVLTATIATLKGFQGGNGQRVQHLAPLVTN